MGLKYEFIHKDGAKLTVPVTPNNNLTEQQIKNYVNPSPEFRHKLLVANRLVRDYWDWEYNSTLYTDCDGNLTIYSKTKGKEPNGERRQTPGPAQGADTQPTNQSISPAEDD